MFKNLFTWVVPTARAATEPQEEQQEEELVDPMEVLREKCRALPEAIRLAEKLDECNARVSSKSRTTETCMPELYDLLHVIDACVTKDLFCELK